MSALWAPATGWPDDIARSPERSKLRAVAAPAGRLARFPFMLVLIGTFGVGMAGLLMLNTTLQNQVFDSRALTRQATELTYVQADLENQLDAVAAPQELARRASALGMRPNPHPAFLELPKGRVIGKPQAVSGNELPGLIVKTPAEIQAEKATARALAEAKAAEKAAKAKAAEKKAAEKKAAEKKAAEKKAAEKKAAEKKAAEKKAAEKKAASAYAGR